MKRILYILFVTVVIGAVGIPLYGLIRSQSRPINERRREQIRLMEAELKTVQAGDMVKTNRRWHLVLAAPGDHFILKGFYGEQFDTYISDLAQTVESIAKRSSHRDWEAASLEMANQASDSVTKVK